jgi:inosine/xanthosine triphosphatase
MTTPQTTPTKIIVGSTNEAKLKAVMAGVKAYWPTASVDGATVQSGVPDQPIGLEQTMQGALNRARAAKAQGADLGVGLEGGVMKLNGQWVMMGFVAVTDGEREFTVPTAGTPLPRTWGQAMLAGGELRPHVVASGMPYDYTKGVVGLLTNDTVKRDEGFAMALKCALAPWVNPSVYSTT